MKTDCAQYWNYPSATCSAGTELQAREKLAKHLGVAIANLKLKPKFRPPVVRKREAVDYKGISFHKNLGRFVANSGRGLNAFVNNLFLIDVVMLASGLLLECLIAV
jgi:hypothetical protein